MKLTYNLIIYLAGVCTTIIPIIVGFFMSALRVPMAYMLFGLLFSGLMNSVMLSMLIRPKRSE